MTSSPFFTVNGAFSPLSRRLPSPTATILPRLGFSLAVSGRTMPDLVFDSASTRLIRILSPRGRSFAIANAPVKTVREISEIPQTDPAAEPRGSRARATHSLLFRWPLAFVVAAHDARQRVEQQVEIDRLAQHAEHMHADRLLQQVRRELVRQQDGRRRVLDRFAHALDDLQTAQLR